MSGREKRRNPSDATVELGLDSLAFGGEAVGRDATGRVVFVSGGAPGDRVRVRLVEEKRNFARGEIVELVAAGAARVTPACAIADRCGGCPWMHVAVGEQLRAKQDIVARALGPTGATVEPIIASPRALAYRTRARMTRRGGHVGFVARRSHEVVDVEHCPALDPVLDGALQAARRAIGDALGEDGTLAGGLVRDDDGTPRVRLWLVAGQGADRRALARAAQLLESRDDVAGVAFAAPPFAQANAEQNETLRRLVREAARADGQRVLELYAGDGNFTRDLAATAARGIAVEGDAAAVARLGQTLRDPRWELRAAPVAPAVLELAGRGERFDVVVLDPPRTGAADAVAAIARLDPARIVYVSCDPMTLARDLKTLVGLGYRPQRAWPVDMMPQTFHVEVVCLIERAS